MVSSQWWRARISGPQAGFPTAPPSSVTSVSRVANCVVERRAGRRSRARRTRRPMPAATISSARGPASPDGDDAEREDRRSRDAERRGEVDPAAYHQMQRDAEHDEAEPDARTATPWRRDRRTRGRGRAPRSPGASGRAGAPSRRGSRASMRMAGEEVTRGTTSAVNTLHAVTSDDDDARDERDQAGDRLHGAILPDARARSARTRRQRAASLAAAGPLATSAAGTSTGRERSSSPRPFACVSRRRFEATPQPRMPWTTKFTARRFGSG